LRSRAGDIGDFGSDLAKVGVEVGGDALESFLLALLGPHERSAGVLLAAVILPPGLVRRVFGLAEAEVVGLLARADGVAQWCTMTLKGAAHSASAVSSEGKADLVLAVFSDQR
jgi:hypothetical protein